MKGLKKYEFDMYEEADKGLSLTPQGKEELLDIRAALDIDIVPHGVDVEHFSFSDPDREERSIVFVGNYLHYPNADAVLYFARVIWPQVKEQSPELKFTIVGQAPPPEIKRLEDDPAVVVTGRVADVTPYLKKSTIFICPVRLGGGFRGKILEAMAIGRPIVSTSLGAEGIPAQSGKNIILADTPEDFAQGIDRLLQDNHLYNQVSTLGRELVEDKYAWEKGVEVLEDILVRMMDKPPKNTNLSQSGG